jgi:uncharacterized protein (TIGR02391 family)
MDRNDRLRIAYARAQGLRNTIPLTGLVRGVPARDLNTVIDSVSDLIGDQAPQLKVPESGFYESNGEWCNLDVLRSKLGQFLSLMEFAYQPSNKVVEVGSLYNSIQDSDLKARCSDLLSAPGNFDRVINQATQVLEDRIRKLSGAEGTGVPLVNTAINSNLDRALLRISEDREEHEGIAHICRGIMLAFRNPTHHHLTDDISREEALKVCAFIDTLLATIGRARIAKP